MDIIEVFASDLKVYRSRINVSQDEAVYAFG